MSIRETTRRRTRVTSTSSTTAATAATAAISEPRARRRPFLTAVLLAAAALVTASCGKDTSGPRALILADASGPERAAIIDARLATFERQKGRAVRVLRVSSGEAAVELGARGEADVVLVPEAVPVDRFIAAEHGRDAGTLTLEGARLRVLAINVKQHPKVDAQGADLAAFLASN